MLKAQALPSAKGHIGFSARKNTFGPWYHWTHFYELLTLTGLANCASDKRVIVLRDQGVCYGFLIGKQLFVKANNKTGVFFCDLMIRSQKKTPVLPVSKLFVSATRNVTTSPMQVLQVPKAPRAKWARPVVPQVPNMTSSACLYSMSHCHIVA